MRVLTWALLLAFAGLACGRSDAATPAGPQDAAARERASAVIVWSHISDHRDAMGAGVIVGYDGHRLRILTARHVVVFGAITVWRDGRLYPGEIARTFEHRDLAIVDAIVPAQDGLVFTEVTVAESVRAGQPIAVWGENNTGPRLERGTIVSTHLPALGEAERRELVSLTCDACEPGDSGAGVFDEDGRLVAILSKRYRTADGHVVAIVAEPVDATLYAFG